MRLLAIVAAMAALAGCGVAPPPRVIIQPQPVHLIVPPDLLAPCPKPRAPAQVAMQSDAAGALGAVTQWGICGNARQRGLVDVLEKSGALGGAAR